MNLEPPAGSPASTRSAAPGTETPLYVPAEWAPAPPARDLAIDLLRGLAMAILVVNHLQLESPLRAATSSLLSAAEVLVAVSGVVVGMVFGRRWRELGASATSVLLLLRARKLYVASVAVVALAGALSVVPGVAGEAVAVSRHGNDLYPAHDVLGTVASVLTLEAGPWQFGILGFFIVALATAPAMLWLLSRGGWPVLLVLSIALYAIGRHWTGGVLPMQSERPFPVLVWQLLFVFGLVAGWHRTAIGRLVGQRRTKVAALAVAAGAASVLLLVTVPKVMGASDWTAWEEHHFDKRSLDPLRVLAMTSMAALLYVLLRRCPHLPRRAVAAVLLPLGRNSFYVFIVHVFLCLAVATALAATGGSAGPLGNLVVQVACLALLVTMVRRRLLFRWIPR